MMFVVVTLLAIAAIVLSIVALLTAWTNKNRGTGRSQTNRRRTSHRRPLVLSYYLTIADFVSSFIQAPTSNVLSDSTTIASSYLAGRAPLFNASTNQLAGTCSASFLNIQNADSIFTDISNYIATADGLIITWFTPTTLINLELDSLVNGMVTECIVRMTTKVGLTPYYGDYFNLIVSSDGTRINFQFTRIPPV